MSVITHQEILENPIWFGMVTGNSHLVTGDESVRIFPAEISPFAGLRDFTNDDFAQLGNMMPADTVRATFTPQVVEPTVPFELVMRMEILQMVHDATPRSNVNDIELLPLQNKDIPEMLALTKQTNPGPFNHRTIEFGNYYGIFTKGQLVSMAGERLQVSNYTEISAVCTHPDHPGKGYARRLMLFHINRLLAASRIPFLHVKKDNFPAIGLYESLGFKIKRVLHVLVIKKL